MNNFTITENCLASKFFRVLIFNEKCPITNCRKSNLTCWLSTRAHFRVRFYLWFKTKYFYITLGMEMNRLISKTVKVSVTIYIWKVEQQTRPDIKSLILKVFSITGQVCMPSRAACFGVTNCLPWQEVPYIIGVFLRVPDANESHALPCFSFIIFRSSIVFYHLLLFLYVICERYLQKQPVVNI